MNSSTRLSIIHFLASRRAVGLPSILQTPMCFKSSNSRRKKKKNNLSNNSVRAIPSSAQHKGTHAVTFGSLEREKEFLHHLCGAAPFTPTEDDYKALLYDLLLYRRESLQPILLALRKERELLEIKMLNFSKKVEEFSRIREEMRLLLEDCKALDDANLQRVLDTLAAEKETGNLMKPVQESGQELGSVKRSQVKNDGDSANDEDSRANIGDVNPFVRL